MSEVQSVNEDKVVPADNEATGKPWVDPVFLERNPERMSDEPEPSPEEIAEREAEEAAAAEEGRKERGEYTKAELAEMIRNLPDDEEEPEEKAEEAETPEVEKAEEEKAEKEKNAEEAKRVRRRQRREKERAERIRAVEAENAELKKRLAEQETAQPDPQPKLEDFEYDADKFAEATDAWAKRQVAAEQDRVRKAEEVRREEAAKAEAREKYEAFLEREDDMRDLHDDYDEVTRAEDLQITEEMGVVIQESELGPQIAYYLGKNPEEAERIAGLSPKAQIKEIGRIEARLEAEEAKTEETPPEESEEDEGAEEATPPPQKAAKPTQAPEPISTVGGGGSPGKRDPSKMSQDEYNTARLSGKIR